MIIPEYLSKGDRVFFTAPASCINSDELGRAKLLFEERGYEVIVGRSCYEKFHGYLAGSRKFRAAEINEAFEDERYKAVICVRGGYGSAGIIEGLNLKSIRNNPKIFAGYSDITALHTVINGLCKVVTYHAPMPVSDYDKFFSGCTYNSYFSMLEGNNREVHSCTNITNASGTRGILTGGNLSLICHTLGTYYCNDYNDKILFIEDIGESIPRIDSMFLQLFYSGILEKLKAVVFGNFNNCINDKDINYGINELIFEYFAGLNIPVLTGLNAGHCHDTVTLALGEEYMVTKEGLFYRM